MIHRSRNNSQKLDVAGLNEITVFIDRSETQLTEVAFNSWTPGLDGPPHAHEAKEQNFLVLGGRGEVVIGGERFSAQAGDFFYIPAGVVHQSIGLFKDQRLEYFLFNAFLDSTKEGHASFADHIDLVKDTRRKQADTQESGIAPAVGGGRRGKKVETQSFAAPTTTILGRDGTQRCEALHHALAEAGKLEIAADTTKEQTFYVVSGSGIFQVGDESTPVSEGEVVFVPAGTAASIIAGSGGLKTVSFGTVI